MYSTDSKLIETMFTATFSMRRCSTVSVASASAQIHLHSSRNALAYVGSGVSSKTAKPIINAFNSSDQLSLLLLAVIVGSPLSLVVVL